MEHQQRGINQALRRDGSANSLDPLTLDTGGQLRPRYEFVPRHVGRLACGELAIEPVLGLARVNSVTRVSDRPDGAFVQVAWTDDTGPCQATGRYAAETTFSVRLPAAADRLVIQHGLDHAARANRDVNAATARLIAAHLHTGQRSSLYGFAFNGKVGDRLFDELDDISRHRPYAKPWVHALARYCLGREYLGPLPSWRATRTTAWTQATSRGRDVNSKPKPTDGETATNASLLDQEYLRSDLAAQLIEAAFVIGRTTVHLDALSSRSLVGILTRTKRAR